jgi:hypothetical protein
MKLYAFAAAALSTATSAFPLLPWTKMAPPPAGTQFYQLQTKSYVSLSYLLTHQPPTDPHTAPQQQ